MKFIICAVFSVLLAGSEALAGTVSTLRDVGFSANGRYFAFTTTEADGMSGVTCRTTTFINTVRNDWVGRPYRVCKDEAGSGRSASSIKRRKSADRARREIRRLTKKLRIKFKNDGRRAVSRAPFRYWKNTGTVDKEFSKQGESITFSGTRKRARYRLVLNKKPIRSAKCRGMMYGHPPAVMSLHLRNLQSNQRKALQIDQRIPKTRGCPYHYRIQNVYTHPRGRGQVIVTLLQYFSPSIEGPDERYLAVSGRMN